MASRGLLAWAVVSSALAFVGGAPAASRTRPSDRSCLIAWNSSGNQANQLRLLARRPISGLLLRPGRVGTDTWTKGAPPTQRSSSACLLGVARTGTLQVVTGLWTTAGVTHWSFGRPIPTTTPFVANVRLLPDGRVTKIYRR